MLLFLTECPPGVRLSGKLGLWTLTLAKVIYSGSHCAPAGTATLVGLRTLIRTKALHSAAK